MCVCVCVRARVLFMRILVPSPQAFDVHAHISSLKHGLLTKLTASLPIRHIEPGTDAQTHKHTHVHSLTHARTAASPLNQTQMVTVTQTRRVTIMGCLFHWESHLFDNSVSAGPTLQIHCSAYCVRVRAHVPMCFSKCMFLLLVLCTLKPSSSIPI